MVSLDRAVEIDLLGKAVYTDLNHRTQAKRMSTLLVSSKGQIVLPAALRRKLGLGAGTRLEVLEEADGLKLRAVRSVAQVDVKGLAGMVKLPTRGAPRRLEDFDPASLLARATRATRPTRAGPGKP